VGWFRTRERKEVTLYLKTSETIEETTQDSLAHGFTYFMDERDKEWLDKNNEESRGEGTFPQGAVSTPGTATRTSQRSAKAKGKEPDVARPMKRLSFCIMCASFLCTLIMQN
jgi:enhancer of polycomb-like protein